LEELKKAFLGFQQKVEDTKGKLNGFEAICVQEKQRNMAFTAPTMHINSHLNESPISNMQV
jgi:succinylarginine dihydrolase